MNNFFEKECEYYVKLNNKGTVTLSKLAPPDKRVRGRLFETKGTIWYKDLYCRQRSVRIRDFNDRFLYFERVMSEHMPIYKLMFIKQIKIMSIEDAPDHYLMNLIYQETK